MADSENVRVALTGAIYTADLGTTAPADVTTEWASGWVELGFISEDGLTEAYNDDTTTISAWQGGATVRQMITGSTSTFAFTAIETNRPVLEAYHKGSTVTDDEGLAIIEVRAASADTRAWGFDVIDGDTHMRILVPRGEVTERGEITYRNDQPVGYQLTVTAYPDDDGVVAIKMSDAAALLTAP